ICDRMVILRRGEAVLSDTIANLVAVSDHWEVEVTRWQPAFAPRVAEAASGIVRESGDAAVLRCPAERKDDLLRLLLQLDTAIGVLNMWSSGATLIGLFLGATAVSAEVKSKTIVTVLARPVGRAEYLLGKWLGIQLFVLLFVGVGAVAGCAAVHYFQVQPSGLFPLAIGELFV